MCGRYALGVRLAFVRHRLQDHGNPVDEASDDDDVRENYNFAPGNYGAVYRADTPDQGAGYGDSGAVEGDGEDSQQQGEGATDQMKDEKSVKYKLQSMKWGLIPFWTKRSPNYGSLMKTINCRDDSLIEDRGMWTSMKRRKRCIVICQGFYEWLKKGPGGKERVPHFVRRKDGELMCFAGLWNCVKYEDTDEPLYTYTVITTSSNQYLSFLHDRMPVILDMGSPAMSTWLDPHRTSWSKELQSLLKPYEGELECYPVSKEVGKVGNNSPDFMIPVNSKENKKNIANFFANASSKKNEGSKPGVSTEAAEKTQEKATKVEEGDAASAKGKADQPTIKDEQGIEADKKEAEDHITLSQGTKREHSPDLDKNARNPKPKTAENKISTTPRPSPEKKRPIPFAKPAAEKGKKTRSATSNSSAKKSAANGKAKDGTQRITNFFKS